MGLHENSVGSFPAFQSLLMDRLLSCTESFGPGEPRCTGWIITLQMAVQSQMWLFISQRCLAKHFATEVSKFRVVLNELFASVHMIVVVIVLSIVIKPRLDTFCKIFMVIHGCVLALPKPTRHRLLIGRLQPRVKRRINADHPAQMNIMSKLMDEDAFRRIGISFIAQQILFAAGAVRICF